MADVQNHEIAESNRTDSVQSNGEVPAEQAQPSKLETFLSHAKSLIIRAFIIYFITSFFRRSAPPTVETGPNGAPAPVKLPAWNIFENGSVMDMSVFVSEMENFTNFDDETSLVWQKNGLIYGDWSGGPNGDGTFELVTTIDTTQSVRENGSLYLHVFFVKRDQLSKKGAERSKFTGKYVAHATKQLNRYKRLRFTKTQNLLTGETALTPEEVKKAESRQVEIVSHWHPNITINLVTDQTTWVPGQVPPPLNEYIDFTQSGDHYKPVVFFNEFWNMLRDYQPINDTSTNLELRVTYQPLSLFRWQVYSAQTMRSKWTSGLFQEESEEADQDSLKEALLETSPYLLGATVLVSILHSVFELLAFKNDIQFWNNRKSLEGLSVRLVFFNVFQCLIILLYVFDNEANTLIRISCFVSLVIEVWKINKVIDISIDRQNKLFGIIPKLTFQDKGSYVESSTKEYDQLAFRYLSWALYPLLTGYAVYSLIYLEHKGWYSWLLNMIYGFLLTFGFIMMTPQLFINYKLKSVAHLPWRMMSYKCLNTFIDDIFAFVIKMPTMYRLGCFRDDIVFFIFLYQRWIYKIDPTRVNEFGYSAQMETEMAGAPAAVANGEPVAAVKSSQDKKKD